MKKFIALFLVFISFQLLTNGKNFEIRNLNTLPGMPVLHNDGSSKTADQHSTTSDTSLSDVFNYILNKNLHGYIVQMQDFESQNFLTPEQKNISHWVEEKLVSLGYSQMNHGNYGLIRIKPGIGSENGSMGSKNNSAVIEGKMLIAHETPKMKSIHTGKAGVRPHEFSLTERKKKDDQRCLPSVISQSLVYCSMSWDVFLKPEALLGALEPECMITICS
jgi:hypothetical protein